MVDLTVGRAPAGGQVNLGAAAAGVAPPIAVGRAPVGGVIDLGGPVDVGGQAPTSTMGSSMGAAAAALPSIAALPTGGTGDQWQAPVPSSPAAPALMATAASAPPERMSALDTIYTRNARDIADIEAYLDANPVRSVSFDNPERPFAEEAAQFQLGGGQLQVAPFEFVPPKIPRNEGESDEDYAARVQVFAETAYREQLDEYQRNVAEQQAQAQQLGDVRDIGEPGNLGLGEARLQAAENVGDAQIQQQLEVTAAQTRAAETQRAAIEAARQADAERRAFAQQQRDAITQLQETERAARQKVANLPELDPQRYFKSLKGSQKFFGILGAMLGGSIGIDVAAQFRQAAMDDLEAQKANANQAFGQLDSATGAVQQASSLYQDLVRASGDEATADSMWIKLQMEDAAQQLEQVLAKTTEPVLRAELQQQLVEIRAQIQAEDMNVMRTLTYTPERIQTSYDPIGRRERRRLEKERDATVEQQRKLEEKAIDSEEKALDRAATAEGRQFDRETKLLEKGADRQLKREEEVGKQAYQYGKDIEQLDTTRKLIRGVLAQDDIAGYGFTAGLGVMPEAQRTERQLDLILESFGRLQSQGAIGVEEAERFVAMIKAGTTIGGEAALRRNLEEMLKYLDTRLETLERGTPKDVRDYYNRGASAEFGQRWTGPADAPTVVVED